jgi:hypothetical protein
MPPYSATVSLSIGIQKVDVKPWAADRVFYQSFTLFPPPFTLLSYTLVASDLFGVVVLRGF